MKEIDKKYIGQRIATLRNAKKISARNMSLDLGQSSEYINQIENGRNFPSLEGLLNICEYFNISIAEFFDEQNVYPLQYKQLINELNKLDNSELDLIIELVKLITKDK